ncbi:MAG: 2,3-diketo-5-methylthiopentyl-1-phosphate enolase [Deltaproteobacteria bacterium]|nr:2,3-diketo-5-methylthiopentyl-1-phosphate enolase [Deltaproteobacteria bacterium]
MRLDRTLFSTPEGIDRESFVIATYLVEHDSSVEILRSAAALAVEQTTGTWTPVPGETPELRKKHVGRVIAVHEIPAHEFEVPRNVETRQFIVEIAYPWVNFGHQIPMLLSTVFGNISMTGKIKLLDLYLPEKFVIGFRGPQFGIQGIRKILNVPHRPLVLNMVKPCTGYTPEQGAQMFYQAALGGVDIVKDDELIADPPFCPMMDRVKLYMEKEKEVFARTGERTIYTVNVTDRPDRMKMNAKRAVDGGVNGLMVNYLTAGISALQALAEDPAIHVPILAHLDFAGAFYQSPYSGLSSHLVLGKLARLAGADMVVYPSYYGKFPFLKERYVRIAHHLTELFYHIKPTFPIPGGGVHAGMVPFMLEELGNDSVIAAGGAVHGHPDGAVAGAKALRQAVEAAMSGLGLEEAAKEHRELKSALDLWGIYDKSRDRLLFDLK